MKKKLVSFVSFFLISFTLFAQSGKVIKIKDGDTIVVLDTNKNQITLRLAEVDCPESSQDFGKKAKSFTAEQVALKIVNYKVTGTDRYGRSIAKVYYDNKYLSAEIIKNGFGWHYKKFSKSDDLRKLELSARSKKIGLWSDKNCKAPWEYRNDMKVKF
ncbi:thermonuclease family protein [Flavobacterium sp. 17A]|uniref:Thermonuclease family protein n=1 Tax=Flavobacterium potami TaxID=2872310 RepID=A0A9X1KST2_9FLAO|nr:thermonuclease family protein [Flavobacterium potami]MBZ4037825.1 thermonuclease family protein [Flavobacterium potami]